ncbi:hypothetical protein HY224_00940 [Candidatus Uhrbacteria bacterium]|nr:hypothetical protein [Candidatus Uhrbacteria bacterium]
MKLPKDEVQRQWKQLMYFFATIYVLAKCGSLLPGNKQLQPPPKLEPIWRFFRERMPAQFTEYCHVFWGGQDVGWRESYPPEHQLTVQRLVMIRRTAGQGMTGV